MFAEALLAVPEYQASAASLDMARVTTLGVVECHRNASTNERDTVKSVKRRDFVEARKRKRGVQNHAQPT